MKIFRMTDRIPVKIGELTVWFGPLTYDQKAEINGLVQMRSGEEKVDGYRLAFLSLKYGVKGVDGVKDSEDKPYQVEFEESGMALTDDCTMDLIGLGDSQKVIMAVTRLVNEIKEYEIQGVKIDLKGVKSTKKKSS